MEREGERWLVAAGVRAEFSFDDWVGGGGVGLLLPPRYGRFETPSAMGMR